MVTIGGDYLGTAFEEGICGQHPQFPAAHGSSHITQGRKLKKAVHWREVLACSAMPSHAAWLEPVSQLCQVKGWLHWSGEWEINLLAYSPAQSTPDQAAKGVC